MSTSKISHLVEHPALPLIAGATALCGCFAVAAADPTTPGGMIPECPTKAILGINCPGCGTARMIYSVMNLHFLDAIRYNVVALVLFALVGWSWFAWLARTFGKHVPDWMNWRYAGEWVVGVFIAWFIIRLLPFEPFVSLQV
ncbi:hypothetical protein CKALI_10280 [Corynebacterium kalinowskii]|uniref:DUF2752 domain-containing protein n=1 Tax=Corynebacterium kalinowskii TaxID=2675216 RepID=A0A6B8VSN5_9CORY|nr:DUF2752 domain-containing protein [Corynebacterium kalinowskii]QGU02911.1 hypothetical protein CKALI_10280 [Corynebacterium kalinowskii]